MSEEKILTKEDGYACLALKKEEKANCLKYGIDPVTYMKIRRSGQVNRESYSNDPVYNHAVYYDEKENKIVELPEDE